MGNVMKGLIGIWSVWIGFLRFLYFMNVSNAIVIITAICPVKNPVFSFQILSILKKHRINTIFSKRLRVRQYLNPIMIVALQYPHDIIVGETIGIL